MTAGPESYVPERLPDGYATTREQRDFAAQFCVIEELLDTAVDGRGEPQSERLALP
jgi:hypothetical protein